MFFFIIIKNIFSEMIIENHKIDKNNKSNNPNVQKNKLNERAIIKLCNIFFFFSSNCMYKMKKIKNCSL